MSSSQGKKGKWELPLIKEEAEWLSDNKWPHGTEEGPLHFGDRACCSCSSNYGLRQAEVIIFFGENSLSKNGNFRESLFLNFLFPRPLGLKPKAAHFMVLVSKAQQIQIPNCSWNITEGKFRVLLLPPLLTWCLLCPHKAGVDGWLLGIVTVVNC